jgi:polysaccharide biosynthesis transport protein
MEMSMYKTIHPAQSDAETEPMSVAIREYWGIVVRRKWLVVASILTGLIIGGVLCVVLPKSYRSSTEILIENQKIPDEYVKGIGGGNIEARLMMIQQQVMSRSLLSQILAEYKLYEGLIQREGLESAIEKLRDAITVETVGTAASVGLKKRTVETVTISFAGEDPIIAMKVTAKLASLFIEENLKDREQLVTGVSAFLEQELQDAKKALEDQEQAISQYKTKYMGLLPEQMEANLRTLDRLQMELNTTNDLLHSRTDKVSSLDRSINEYQASAEARPEFSEPRLVRKDVDPLIVRLQQLEQRLTTLRAEWKETYPDISDTKQEIVSVKEQLVEKYGTSFMEQNGLENRDEPVAIRKDLSTDLYLRELKTQHSDVITELSSLKSRRDRLLQLIKETEGRVEQAPVREQELSILVRDYENRQKNYQTLLDKRLNAHVAGNLEKRQKGEQFRILDPANLPEKLESPNRVLIMLLSFLGGCGGGIALAFGLDHANPTFRRREDVELLPDVRVLATVPLFTLIPDQGESARRSNGLIEHGPHWSLVAKWQPTSIAAEQYRMAATRMLLSTERRRSTVIEITSALEGEGKTTTVANLGYTIARDLGRRTVLIDCDFRRPALHQFVSVPARAGLLDLLDGEDSLEDCLSIIDEVPCSIITVGRSKRAYNELARVEQLKELLPQLRAQFQYLIINTPPVLASATMEILASLADEIVMVVKSGSSPQHVVLKGFAMLGLSGERHVILNGVDEQSLPHYLYGYSMPYGEGSVVESVPR